MHPDPILYTTFNRDIGLQFFKYYYITNIPMDNRKHTLNILILWVYYTIPFGFSLFWHCLDIIFHLFKLLRLAKDNLRGFSTRNAHMVHIVN